MTILFFFHYANFFVLFLVPFCFNQIFSSASYFQIAWFNILFSLGEILSVTPMKTSDIIVLYNLYVLHPVASRTPTLSISTSLDTTISYKNIHIQTIYIKILKIWYVSTLIWLSSSVLFVLRCWTCGSILKKVQHLNTNNTPDDDLIRVETYCVFKLFNVNNLYLNIFIRNSCIRRV
jgi:hypothetical protein